MDSCLSCTRALDDGLLYLDAQERTTGDQAAAEWKSCPRCSQIAGAHVFLPLKSFGSPIRQRRSEANPGGLQSDCTFHRNNANKKVPRPMDARRVCGAAPGAVSPNQPQPVARPAGNAAAASAGSELTLGQLDVLVDAQVDWIELSEEGRKVLRTHLATERKSANRRSLLLLRASRGPLTCDACGENLAEVYGKEHADVVELHHLRPLSRGVQKPSGTEAFALLCPTCHRVAHHRRVEPLTIEQLRARFTAAET